MLVKKRSKCVIDNSHSDRNRIPYLITFLFFLLSTLYANSIFAQPNFEIINDAGEKIHLTLDNSDIIWNASIPSDFNANFNVVYEQKQVKPQFYFPYAPALDAVLNVPVEFNYCVNFGEDVSNQASNQNIRLNNGWNYRRDFNCYTTADDTFQETAEYLDYSLSNKDTICYMIKLNLSSLPKDAGTISCEDPFSLVEPAYLWFFYVDNTGNNHDVKYWDGTNFTGATSLGTRDLRMMDCVSIMNPTSGENSQILCIMMDDISNGRSIIAYYNITNNTINLISTSENPDYNPSQSNLISKILSMNNGTKAVLIHQSNANELNISTYNQTGMERTIQFFPNLSKIPSTQTTYLFGVTDVAQLPNIPDSYLFTGYVNMSTSNYSVWVGLWNGTDIVVNYTLADTNFTTNGVDSIPATACPQYGDYCYVAYTARVSQFVANFTYYRISTINFSVYGPFYISPANNWIAGRPTLRGSEGNLCELPESDKVLFVGTFYNGNNNLGAFTLNSTSPDYAAPGDYITCQSCQNSPAGGTSQSAETAGCFNDMSSNSTIFHFARGNDTNMDFNILNISGWKYPTFTSSDYGRYNPYNEMGWVTPASSSNRRISQNAYKNISVLSWTDSTFALFTEIIWNSTVMNFTGTAKNITNASDNSHGPFSLVLIEIYSSSETTPSGTPTINISSGSTFSSNATFEISGVSDADGDTLYYEIYYGTSSPPATLIRNTSSSLYTTTWTSPGTYYYRFNVTDGTGYSNQSNVFNLTLVESQNTTNGTYETYDDFNGVTLNTSKWIVVALDASVRCGNDASVSSGRMFLSSNCDNDLTPDMINTASQIVYHNNTNVNFSVMDIVDINVSSVNFTDTSNCQANLVATITYYGNTIFSASASDPNNVYAPIADVTFRIAKINLSLWNVTRINNTNGNITYSNSITYLYSEYNISFYTSTTTNYGTCGGDTTSTFYVNGIHYVNHTQTSVESTYPASVTDLDYGIQNALVTGFSLYTDQLVYARSAQGLQGLATFDRVVKKGNKAWAFNYLESGESASGFFNLSPVLYVLELSNLTNVSLISIVETTINNTK